jgi:hypothetical protein
VTRKTTKTAATMKTLLVEHPMLAEALALYFEGTKNEHKMSMVR